MTSDAERPAAGLEPPSLAPFSVSPGSLATAALEFARRGVAILGPPALEPGVFRALEQEAAWQRRHASWRLRNGDGRSRVPEDDVRAELGPEARNLLASPSTVDIMRTVTGRTVGTSWRTSCYTYYDFPGSHLGRHTDRVETCHFTMLLGILSEWQGGADPPGGNQLWVYTSFRDSTPKYRVTTLANRVAILDGIHYPHERPPLGPEERVTVLSACFEAYSHERVPH
jgi:hypothetical protein